MIYTRVEIDPNYNRKSKPNKKGTYPIYVMIRELRKKTSIAPKIPNIRIEDFQDSEGKWIKKNVTNYREYNSIINKVKSQIDIYLANCSLNGTVITVKSVKDWYEKNYSHEGKKVQSQEQTFEMFFDHFISSKRGNKVNYQSALNKVKEYNPNVSFNEMTRAYFTGLASFLDNPENNMMAGSTAKEYFNKVKVVYNEWCRELDKPFNSRLFEKIQFSDAKKRKKYALTKEQLIALENMKFGDGKREKHREEIRDLFLFLCYTSRSYKEIANLTCEDNLYFEGEDKSYAVIVGNRTKEGRGRFENPLYPRIVRKIFDKYHPEYKGKLFPNITYNHSNPSVSISRNLEVISNRLELEFNLNQRIARYTFKSTVANQYPHQITQRMMGHKKIQTQQEYSVANNDMFRTLKDLLKED
ncbi:phage integrase SAM-like domain-containing protein [Echinicola sp. CAU 1574]|uniref:Phage integrase SAM-like domain-containing protein n=1 Tax=Echinicola arenosa TaxID=2774144 RepID=A0ABR9AT79_9BACT|nr:phage integrase SAM-like domain-containing protein [Echinicola arenosa]MBD8491090.1 phage integrase SAM-like domain-containing protein [Echinicola arenosa]